MKPAAFKYHDPSSVEEALQILAEKENSKILAGGGRNPRRPQVQQPGRPPGSG